MFYLLRPNRTLQWIDYSFDNWVGAVQNNEVNLERLDWKPADESTDLNDALSLALRYGTACSLGILIPGHIINTLTKPQRIRTLHDSAPLPREALMKNARIMEPVSPGWTESLERDMDDIEHLAKTQILNAIQEAEALMNDSATKPELLQHWRDLGGYEPQLRHSAN